MSHRSVIQHTVTVCLLVFVQVEPLKIGRHARGLHANVLAITVLLLFNEPTAYHKELDSTLYNMLYNM